MDLDRILYERLRYTIFDLLADVGGLIDFFYIFFTFTMMIWNYNAMDYLLVSQLFTYREKKSDDVENKKGED